MAFSGARFSGSTIGFRALGIPGLFTRGGVTGFSGGAVDFSGAEEWPVPPTFPLDNYAAPRREAPRALGSIPGVAADRWPCAVAADTLAQAGHAIAAWSAQVYFGSATGPVTRACQASNSASDAILI